MVKPLLALLGLIGLAGAVQAATHTAPAPVPVSVSKPVSQPASVTLSVSAPRPLPAPNALRLTVLTPHPEWGRPLRLLLSGPAQPAPADGQGPALDLGAWAHDVAVLAVETRSSGTGQVQHLLTLSPRRSGKLSLPALHLGHRHSAPLTLHIAAPTLHGQPLDVHLTLPHGVVWQGQQALVTVRIDSPARYARLDSPGATARAGIRLFTLPATRHARRNGGSRLETGWALFPEAATPPHTTRNVPPQDDGTTRRTVALPPVRYLIDGVPRFTFYLPRLHLRIRPLPEYVPPGTPVGRLRIETLRSPGVLVREAHLQFWRLRLRGYGIPAGALPALDQHLSGGQSINLLDTTRTVRRLRKATGLISEVDYTLPFTTRRSGWLSLPRLSLRYFDPLDGRLKTLDSRAPGLLSLNLFWMAVLALALLGALGWTAWQITRAVLQRRRTRRARRLALQALDASQDIPALRAALQQLARAEAWPGNLSLMQWWQHWSRHYAPQAGLAHTLEQLSQACYSGRGEGGQTPQRPARELAELKWRLRFYLRAPHRARTPWRWPGRALVQRWGHRTHFRRLPPMR